VVRSRKRDRYVCDLKNSMVLAMPSVSATCGVQRSDDFAFSIE
jgi:hypothetical protein